MAKRHGDPSVGHCSGSSLELLCSLLLLDTPVLASCTSWNFTSEVAAPGKCRWSWGGVAKTAHGTAFISGCLATSFGPLFSVAAKCQLHSMTWAYGLSSEKNQCVGSDTGQAGFCFWGELWWSVSGPCYLLHPVPHACAELLKGEPEREKG